MCGIREIVRLDDGRSAVDTVARAAIARCRDEKARFQLAAMNRARSLQAALRADAAIESATQSTFASMVLEVRAHRRERGARGAPLQPSAPARRPLDEVAL